VLAAQSGIPAPSIFLGIGVFRWATALKYCPLTCCKLSADYFRAHTYEPSGCRNRSKNPYFLARRKVVRAVKLKTKLPSSKKNADLLLSSAFFLCPLSKPNSIEVSFALFRIVSGAGRSFFQSVFPSTQHSSQHFLLLVI